MSREPAAAPARDTWWGTWAPLWSEIEDRHFGRQAASDLLPLVDEPILVVGAGQGIIVEYFTQRGLRAFGIDLSARMVREGNRRRDLGMLVADAADLPFADGAFATVVVSSGVVDYNSDEASIDRILRESWRVLRPGGRATFAFYRLDPEVEAIYRRLGVLVGDRYHPHRIFEIGRLVERSPLGCVPIVARWSGRSLASSFFYFLGLGLRRPPALADEERHMRELLERAPSLGVTRDELEAAVPEDVPYRSESSIRALVPRSLRVDVEVHRTADCLTAVVQKPAPFTAAAPAASTPTRDVHVRTRGLCKRYPGARHDALRNLHLEIARGEIFGLLGPNGAGKTTAIQVLCGLLSPDRGEVELAHRRAGRPAASALGVVPQELALYPRLTARENLLFFGRLHSIPEDRLRARTGELLAAVGLGDRADDRVETFSGGMKRRLNLAAGLVHDPEFVLLDEPTVGVDPQSRNRIFEILADLKRQGVTVLYTTHYMEEAAAVCDRVAILDLGRELVQGSPDELVARVGRTRAVLDVSAPTASLRQQLLSTLGHLPGVVRLEAPAPSAIFSLSSTVDALDFIEGARREATTRGASLVVRELRAASLEGVFLDLTGRTLRDEPAERSA